MIYRALITTVWLVAASASFAQVGELQGGSVTVPGSTSARTLGARFGETINVRDWGVKCDGSTDDAANITAANDAAVAGNVKVVYFPPSATPCMLSTRITSGAGVVFVAEPGTVTLKPTPTGNTSNPVLMGMGSGSSVYGLSFDGGGQDFGTANNLITAFGVDSANLDHITVQNTRGIPVVFSTGVTNSNVRHSVFKNIGNHWKTTGLAADRQQAVAFCCGTTANNHGNGAYDNTFEDVGLDAISSSNQLDFKATGNRCSLAQGQLTATWSAPVPTAFGACIYGTTNGAMTVSNNQITGAAGNAIDILNTGSAVIDGNSVTLSGQAAIGCFGTSSCTITGNNLRNSGQWTSSLFRGAVTLSGTLGKISIAGNIGTDDQGSPTQQYGVQVGEIGNFTSATFASLHISPDNSLESNVVAPVGGRVSNYSFGSTSDNRVINPCFAIDGPNEGANYAAGGGQRQMMEGWQFTESVSRGTKARSTAQSFPGCGSSGLLYTVTGTGSPAAGDLVLLAQRIDGLDLQDLMYGSASARSLVLDFCARASVGGTYTASVFNIGTARSYLIPFTIGSSTTTCFSFVVPGDTAQAIARTSTAYQFAVAFDLGSGSTFQNATSGSWLAGLYFQVTGTTPYTSNANASTFYISSVRLYPGAQDMPWSQRSMADEYLRTRRRYIKTFDAIAPANNSGNLAGALCSKLPVAASYGQVFLPFPFPVRGGAAPTVTTYNPSATNANWRNVTAGADVTVSVDPGSALSASTGVLIATGATVANAGDVLCIHATVDAR